MSENASTASKAKPTILLPPRVPTALLFANGSGPGFSPGPMTLVSSLFPEQGPFSFSQLLAGAMAKPSFVAAQPPPETLSPLFMLPPPLLSPSGLLNSSGYLSPLQSPFGMSHQQALAHVTAQAALSHSFKQMQSSIETDQLKDPTNQESSRTEFLEIPQSNKKSNKQGSDGYKWRKYGQKQVKTSECLRSYYKCSRNDCPVKKKVQKSLDGCISDITYKGQHNHDPPKPNKRAEKKTVLPSQGQIEANKLVVESANNVVEDRAIVACDGGGDERVAKKRRLDSEKCVAASSHQTQSVAEAKIVSQTRSEVDLLDDGYKWRKYGQKVVKGNPHPRQGLYDDVKHQPRDAELGALEA